MASSRRTKSRRRSESRAPAVWHGAAGPVASRERTVSHRAESGFRPGWRAASATIVLGMLGVLGVFFVSNAFYVHTVAVGGMETLTKVEVFALTDVANFHLFWIDPEQVRENLIASPTITEAEVRLGWPPQMIQIVIRERQPALVWEQAGVATWIDLQGQVMQLREDRDTLIRVSYEGVGGTEDPLGPNDRVPVDVVSGALQLRELLLDVRLLRYNPDYGLGFRDARGWDAWFGTGTDMPDKILIYNALVENLQGRGIQPDVISVADPEAVYYSTLLGR
ncbi:MAG: FtsQ-type POTRA domain-containing protein [Chloroflexota bacterium]